MKDYLVQFRLVEVQQTFYKLPALDTALKWRRQAPGDFEFTVKASQLITHPATSPTYRRSGLTIPPGAEQHYGFFRRSEEVHKAWEQTMSIARALEARVVLFQCPPSFRETQESIDNLRGFFGAAKNSGFLLVWEPRGDWSDRTVEGLCADLGLIHCVDPFEREPLHGEPQYFRLHGGPGYRHRYSEDELRALRDKAERKDTYVLLNNLNMYQDALTFARMVEEIR